MRAAAFNLGLGTNVTPTCAELLGTETGTAKWPGSKFINNCFGQPILGQ